MVNINFMLILLRETSSVVQLAQGDYSCLLRKTEEVFVNERDFLRHGYCG